MNSLIYTARKKKVIAVAIVGVLLVVLSYGYRCALQKVCGHNAIDHLVRSSASAEMPNGNMVFLEVANTPESRELGLSRRTSLAVDEGMLFVFDELGHYAFWMKDMEFPIDIIWLDQDGIVVNVENNATPASYFETKPPKVFINRPSALYVLELKAGEASEDGVYLGTKIKLDF